MLLSNIIADFNLQESLAFIMSEVLNANPTIRNASDLPTRRRRMSSPSDKQNSLGLFASSIPSSTYLNDPFEPVPASSNSESDDGDTVEPIDEQEIYGKPILQFGVYFQKPQSDLQTDMPLQTSSPPSPILSTPFPWALSRS